MKETIEIYEIVEDMTILDNFQFVKVDGRWVAQVLEQEGLQAAADYPAKSEFVIVKDDDSDYVAVSPVARKGKWVVVLFATKFAVKKTAILFKETVETEAPTWKVMQEVLNNNS